MMDTFVLCSGCSRHVRADETACPFCGAAATAAPPRRFASIGTGASRSRRYAVRAALLAGTATASCSQGDGTNTAQGQGGTGLLDASTGTGASAQGGAGQGGATGQGGALGVTGGRTGNGGASGGGTSGGATGSGGGGATGGGGGKLVPGRACPGFADDDPARVCRTSADCALRPGFMAYCLNSPRPQTACPNPRILPVHECGRNAPCPPEWTCVDIPQCRASACSLTTPCTDQNCNGDRSCVNGACMPIPCDQPNGQKCPDGYECVPNAPAGQPWCRAALCTNGYQCPTPLICSGAYPDIHGCGGPPCQKDADCPCGYCLNGVGCAPQLGVCDYQILAMPYGCVWPDEELV